MSVFLTPAVTVDCALITPIDTDVNVLVDTLVPIMKKEELITYI